MERGHDPEAIVRLPGHEAAVRPEGRDDPFQQQLGNRLLGDLTLRQQGQSHQRLELGGEALLLLEAVFEALHQPGVLECADHLGGGLEDDRISRPAPGRIARAQRQKADGLVAAAQRNQEARAETLSREDLAQLTALDHRAKVLQPDDLAGPLESGGDFWEIAGSEDGKHLLAQSATRLDRDGVPFRPGHNDAGVRHGRLAEALEPCLGYFASCPRPPGRHRE